MLLLMFILCVSVAIHSLACTVFIFVRAVSLSFFAFSVFKCVCVCVFSLLTWGFLFRHVQSQYLKCRAPFQKLINNDTLKAHNLRMFTDLYLLFSINMCVCVYTYIYYFFLCIFVFATRSFCLLHFITMILFFNDLNNGCFKKGKKNEQQKTTHIYTNHDLLFAR